MASTGMAQKGGGNAAQGKLVFEQCAVCHEASDTRKMGPSLKGLFKRKTFLNGRVAVTEAAVRSRIDTGGQGMPPYQEMLDRQEKDNLIAYLKAL